MKAAPGVFIAELPIRTVHGTFVARYSETGLVELHFPDEQHAATSEAPLRTADWHTLTSRALDDALSGRTIAELPPLDLRGSDFQKAVWAEIRRIQPGCTVSYSEVASRIGRPNAVRAVGVACGANPIPVLIPCHRVLAAGGKIGGFSGGLNWKRKLLALETASVTWNDFHLSP